MARQKKRSKYEDMLWDEAVHSGVDIAYEPESLFVEVPWDYTPDFLLRTKSGKLIYIEAKGGNSYRYFDSKYRKKFAAAFAQHGGKYDLRLLCQKNFKIGKIKTVESWAKNIGIPVAFGEKIPEEWINE